MCISCHASTATSNCLQYTPPKTNIEPENLPFETDNHLPNLLFWVQHVSFRGVQILIPPQNKFRTRIEFQQIPLHL